MACVHHVYTSNVVPSPSYFLASVVQASHQHVQKELARTSTQLADSIASVGALDEELAAAKAKYTYMQEIRGYIADLCDMLQVRRAALAPLHAHTMYLHPVLTERCLAGWDRPAN